MKYFKLMNKTTINEWWKTEDTVIEITKDEYDTLNDNTGGS